MNPIPHERRDYRLDPGTIGGSDAAKILAEKLNDKENKKFARQILSRLHKYNKVLNEVGKLNDPDVRTTMIDLVRREYMTNFMLCENYPAYHRAGFASFVLNVMDTAYKQHRNEK